MAISNNEGILEDYVEIDGGENGTFKPDGFQKNRGTSFCGV